VYLHQATCLYSLSPNLLKDEAHLNDPRYLLHNLADIPGPLIPHPPILNGGQAASCVQIARLCAAGVDRGIISLTDYDEGKFGAQLRIFIAGSNFTSSDACDIALVRKLRLS
jgi:hypothetical protein